MTSQERGLVLSVLTGVFILVSIDIFNDSQEGVVNWHIAFEGIIALFALAGLFVVLRNSFETKHELRRANSEAEKWRTESKKYLEGLSGAIDAQLEKWQLTKAEKEVAFLLLKGLSSKEIADVRNTTEKTVRVQATAIYAKSGIANRSELSAFFLEDLLVPQRA